VTNNLLRIGPHSFRSRLILGTGKYPSPEVMRQALEASGTELVTVAVRRVDLKSPAADPVLGHLDLTRYKILPNTAACYTSEEAIRTARLALGSGLSNLIKLEVIGDPKTLLPDTTALLEATQILVKEGFIVMPYTNDDPIMAKRLEEAGAACVMPLAAPIGSGQGILNPMNIRFILEAVKIPVIVDAGVGTASDAAIAMELGVDGVLMNTGVAGAKDPVAMAQAMRLAVEAGRLAYLAGRIPKKVYASASSPETGKVGT
jgi:thiazole synthase